MGTVAQNYENVFKPEAILRNGKVHVAVGIKIACCDRPHAVPPVFPVTLREGSIPVAVENDITRAVSKKTRDQIQIAIAVQVHDG